MLLEGHGKTTVEIEHSTHGKYAVIKAGMSYTIRMFDSVDGKYTQISDCISLEDTSSFSFFSDSGDRVHVSREGEKLIFSPPQISYGSKITINRTQLF